MRHVSVTDRGVNWSTGQLVKAVVHSGQILVNIVKMVKQEGRN